MSAPLFAQGLAFGFVLAASVGPMWLLCFRRSLAHGARAGFVSGLGVAAADGLYAAVAAFGLSAVSAFLLEQRFWIALAGSAGLVWLGVRALAAEPPALHESTNDTAGGVGQLRRFASTLALTLANPPTILAFAAIFAGLGLGARADYGAAASLVAGVTLGSAAWWGLLACLVAALRERIGVRFLRAVNLLSGLTLLAFALWQLLHL